jgi:hypothetical protein
VLLYSQFMVPLYHVPVSARGISASRLTTCQGWQTCRFRQVSLTFAPSRRLTPALSRKEFLFDPPPGP